MKTSKRILLIALTTFWLASLQVFAGGGSGMSIGLYDADRDNSEFYNNNVYEYHDEEDFTQEEFDIQEEKFRSEDDYDYEQEEQIIGF